MNTRLYMRNCPRTMLTLHLPTILVSDHVHVSLCDRYEMLAPSLHWRISRNEPPYRSPAGLALPKRRAIAATMRSLMPLYDRVDAVRSQCNDSKSRPPSMI